MRWLLVIALLALSDCWMGTDFYAGARPRAVIAPGEYLQHEPGSDTPIRMRVEVLRNGMTRLINLDDDDKDILAGFFPLPRARNVFVARITRLEGQQLPPNRIAYAIIQPQPNGEYRGVVPICDETEAIAAANRARQVNDDPAFSFCIFTSRRRLEAALRVLVPQLPEGRRLVPIRGN